MKYIKRRSFIKGSVACALTTPVISNNSLLRKMHRMKVKNIGIQLFSIPKLLDEDLVSGLDMLQSMGYNEVELFGPFEFSAQSAKDAWGMITPMLGFDGSGYFGKSTEELKELLQSRSISTTSIHTDLDTLQEHMEGIAQASEVLGFTYAAIPMIPAELRTSIDDYKRVAEIFNKIGESAKSYGLKFAYHNHGYGLQEEDGVVPLQLLMDETDKDLVFFEMDIYWTTAGNADPVEYLTAYPDRYKLLHIKDMREKVHFSGDGGDPSQWMGLFPYMTSAGEGVLDVESIIKTAQGIGVEHYFVEQDLVQNPKEALTKSIDFIAGV